MTVSEWIAYVDQRVWGPGMLVLLMGTGVFLTLRTRFLPWRNLGWALVLGVTGDTEYKLAQTIAAFLGRHMES